MIAVSQREKSKWLKKEKERKKRKTHQRTKMIQGIHEGRVEDHENDVKSIHDEHDEGLVPHDDAASRHQEVCRHGDNHKGHRVPEEGPPVNIQSSPLSAIKG